jgi:hypothetical protein
MPTFIEDHPIDEAIAEDSSFRWRGKLRDADGTAIPTANVTAIAGTLVDGDGVVVNGRDAQDMLAANGGSVSNDGTDTYFTIQFTADDAQTPGVSVWHKRRLTIHIIYNTGELTHQVRFFVGNLEGAP